MSFNVRTTSNFEKEFKALFKRYRSLKKDMGNLIDSLSENPFQGDELSPGIRKIRIAIASKGRGKAGGARVITYTVAISKESGNVYLMSIYDKSDFSTIDVEIIKDIIKKLDLQ